MDLGEFMSRDMLFCLAAVLLCYITVMVMRANSAGSRDFARSFNPSEFINNFTMFGMASFESSSENIINLSVNLKK